MDASQLLAVRVGAAPGLSRPELERLVGGKAAALAEMSQLGLPVPPAFTLTTDACHLYLQRGWTSELDDAVRLEMRRLEQAAGSSLGDDRSPLLVSVRSGASVSMPGMMATVLDVGVTDAVEAALAAWADDAGFAADTHRRGLLSYAEAVTGSSGVNAAIPPTASPAQVRALLRDVGVTVSDDPLAQVVACVRAVFDSWNSEPAAMYRSFEGIDGGLGTSATVQVMVFGNLGPGSGTGVAFSRDPSTGAPGLMGDFLTGAQGEDVVSGSHRTRPVDDMRTLWPDAFEQLSRAAERLERHYADIVDIEYTVERGCLWFLQVRRAKRSRAAALRSAVDMADDPSFPVDRTEAVRRCRNLLSSPTAGPDGLNTSRSDVDYDDQTAVIASGLPASPGTACGVLCTDIDHAVELQARGVEVVLVRPETTTSDVGGMAAAVGLVTTRGGLVSHAAIVARSWDLPAVVGATELKIAEDGVVGPGGRAAVGAIVTVDGDRGRLLIGRRTRPQVEPPEVAVLRSWAAELAGDALPMPVTPTPETDDSSRFRVLHALRIKRMAPPHVLAAMTGIGSDALVGMLVEFAREGDAEEVAARGFYRLTDAGRRTHEVHLALALREHDVHDVPYEAFSHLDIALKALCTDWQIRHGEANDHDDPEYDGRIVERLRRLDDDAQPLIDAFASAVPWARQYPSRFRRARERVLAGDPKALTGVMCESYHDVWMDLHEDLVLTLGVERAEKDSEAVP
jgi:pyruvate, orthophosphate dikinase